MRRVRRRAEEALANLAYLRRPPIGLAVCAIFRNEAIARWIPALKRELATRAT
jgi:hypothetical protein